jgi:hypothetical protein
VSLCIDLIQRFVGPFNDFSRAFNRDHRPVEQRAFRRLAWLLLHYVLFFADACDFSSFSAFDIRCFHDPVQHGN